MSSRSEQLIREHFSIDPEGCVPTQCISCRHQSDGPDLTCSAFPDGIPEIITLNGFDHRRPFVGPDGVLLDHGIRYEPIAGTDPQFLARLDRVLDNLPPNA